ncbi:DUF3429 domain-containing protein [Brachymonas sp.]|uniref:DUF3429 domain-containing protein n=1 Tax=unclassified Brachymonas TaxID=2621329 RepID=UPI0035B1EC5C
MLPEHSRTFIRSMTYLGTIPLMGMAVLMWLVHHEVHGFVAVAMTSYAGIVVSFLGGVHWGIGLRSGVKAPKLHFIWGAVAAFFGWFGALMEPSAGLPFLAFMFVLCYVVDDRTWEHAGLSEWINLRFHVTVVAVLSCLVGAAGSL